MNTKPLCSQKLESVHYLISGQQREVVRRIGDHVAFAARIATATGVTKPVQANAQHAVRLEGRHEQIAVLARLAELRQRSIVQGDLANAAAAQCI